MEDREVYENGCSQIGRWFAVLFFAPWLLLRGHTHRDGSLIALGMLLLVWDTMWLLFAEPRRAEVFS
jgi:hypothetical protein